MKQNHITRGAFALSSIALTALGPSPVATAFLREKLDAGRPVVIDFKYIGPQYPGGAGGHTLGVCGQIAAESLYILCNPAIASPGLQLMTVGHLKKCWRSDGYSTLSGGVLSPPAIVIDHP